MRNKVFPIKFMVALSINWLHGIEAFHGHRGRVALIHR